MKVKSEELIEELIESTRKHINTVERYLRRSPEELNWRPEPGSWSVLECIEHLNLYGKFYIPEIESRIKETDRRAETWFKSGWLGNYFANSMLPKEKLNKMKTFKDKNPLGRDLDKTVLEHFLKQQFKLLSLLGQSREVSLNKTRISISISRVIRLKLGDTFRFIINHNLRHMVQAERVLAEMEKSMHRDNVLIKPVS